MFDSTTAIVSVRTLDFQNEIYFNHTNLTGCIFRILLVLIVCLKQYGAKYMNLAANKVFFVVEFQEK